MKSSPFKRLAVHLSRLVAVPFLLISAGCYSDPNIAPGQRVRFPDDDMPQNVASAGTTSTDVAPPILVSNATPPAPAPAPLPGDPHDLMPSGGIAGGKIAIGDTLTILFSDTPPNAMPPLMLIKVGNEGSITLPLNVIIQALGKTPTELERAIRSAYVPAYFVNLSASVKAEERYFFVGGEVKLSGRQLYTSHSMTVLRAITTAGGFTDFAKKTKIEVRRANGGKTENVNYYKALKDPRLDLPVFPNDQIIVPRGI